MPVGNSAFKELVDSFLDQYNAFYPHNASFLLGLHAFDGRVPDFSVQSITNWQATLSKFLQQLRNEIDFAGLDKLEAYDYKLVEYQLELELLKHGPLRWYERNPIMPYMYIFDVSNYIKRNYAPLEERVEALCRHLEALPQMIDQMTHKLDSTMPRAAVEIALETFGGFARYYTNDLSKVEGLNNSALQLRLNHASRLAGVELQRLVEFFSAQLPLPEQDFAIGLANYSALLKWGEMVDLPLPEVQRIGMADIARNQAALRQVCLHIDSGRSMEEVIQSVNAEHPANDEVINTTRRYLEGIRQHLIRANIVPLPNEVRCLVDETPPHMRWVFADMETPGPFETVATEAHFYITPANPEWPLVQQERWLSRFNNYVIQIFSMHEAYPGHYLQFLHARNSPSRAAKILGSYSFIEGWAHYCEQMMLEEGYGAQDPVLYAKLQLAQLQEALVRDCRYICGIGLHTQQWSVQQAVEFYMQNAWMEEVVARKEAQRSTFDPAGLNYTLGKMMFYRLREDYQKEKGGDFSLSEFHAQCLSYGMPPVPLLRTLLLRDISGPAL